MGGSELPGVETKESRGQDAERKEAPPLQAEDDKIADGGTSDEGADGGDAE